MGAINLKFDGHLAIIELNRPKANALNREMCIALTEAMSKLKDADYVRGAVLTGQGNIFCAGLDLVELYGYDEEEMNRFWEDFHRMLVDMAGFPKPLVAAINGHAPAGGCVLAMLCDHRVMADGDFKIGLNEIPVGIIVPKPVVNLAAFTTGHTNAARMFLNGLMMNTSEAVRFGLVEDFCPQSEVRVWAETRLSKWLSFSDAAWRETKVKLREPLVKAMEMSIAEGYGDTIRTWWTRESRAAMGKLIDGLKKKQPA